LLHNRLDEPLSVQRHGADGNSFLTRTSQIWYKRMHRKAGLRCARVAQTFCVCISQRGAMRHRVQKRNRAFLPGRQRRFVSASSHPASSARAKQTHAVNAAELPTLQRTRNWRRFLLRAMSRRCWRRPWPAGQAYGSTNSITCFGAWPKHRGLYLFEGGMLCVDRECV
jgi:hypothetical protein